MSLINKLAFIRIYRGWYIVGVLFLSTAIYVGASQYAFGLFIEPLEEQFGWSRTQITASLSFTAVGALASPILGRMMDNYGARPVLSISLFLVAISFLLRPLMTELWHWYALSAIQFIGMSGGTSLPIGRLVGLWFRKTRGRVFGITSMGNNFGGLVIPPLITSILVIASWETAYVLLGLISLTIMVIAVISIKEHPERYHVGIRNDSFTTLNHDNSVEYSDTDWEVSKALQSKTFYAITAVILMGSFTYSTILPQIIVHLGVEGISMRDASLALSLLAILGMTGKLVFGYAAEIIGSRYALIICLLGQSLFSVLMLKSSNPLIMWTTVPLYGLCMGAFGALSPLIVQENFGVKYFGSIMGLISLATIIPHVSGPLIAGVSYDLTGNYNTAFIVVSVLFLTASFILMLSTTPSESYLSKAK